MRRLLTLGITMILAVCALLVLPSTAMAYDPFGDACKNSTNGSSSICGTTGEDPISGPTGAIVNVTSILALVAGVIAIIFLIIGGFKYITSNGDSSAVSSAKSTITAALVGLVIAALARPIITFVVSKF